MATPNTQTVRLVLSVTFDVPEGTTVEQVQAAWLADQQEQARRGCSPIFVFDGDGNALGEAAMTAVVEA